MLKPFETIKKDIAQNTWYIVFGFLSIITVDILQLIVPLVIKNAIDTIASGIAPDTKLVRYAVIILIAGGVMAFFRFFWRYCIIGTSHRIEKALRGRLFSHIITLPIAHLLRMKTGDLMARMTNDLEAVRMCTGIGFVALVDTIFLGLASISFMLYISPMLTVISLAPMIFIIFTTWRFSRMLHSRFAKVQAAFSNLTENVRETIAGISVVKSFGREHDSIERFKSVSTDYLQKNIKLVKIWGMFFPVIVFFSNLSIGMLIFFGGRLTVEQSISPGDFVAFASYLWILTWPMMALGWVVNLFQRGSASMVRINDILTVEPEALHDSEKTSLKNPRGKVDVRSLTFFYNKKSAPVLKDLTLSISPGETIGITGKTGSGKTTLCSLLLRFFNPPPGKVFFEGHDICSLSLADIRSAIAYVPQDNFLFSDSLHDNIAFGKPESSPDQIRECAKTAQILDEIMEFHYGFDTVIGEKGVTLSGGQKQRVCIARALLKEASLLIFDDAMSSLDVASTQRIVEALKTATVKRTSIIVSNRIETIKHADKIFVLEEGEIVGSGTHQELLDARGLYYNLYLRQQLEN